MNTHQSPIFDRDTAITIVAQYNLDRAEFVMDLPFVKEQWLIEDSSYCRPLRKEIERLSRIGPEVGELCEKFGIQDQEVAQRMRELEKSING